MAHFKSALPLIVALFLAGAGQAPASNIVGDLDLIAKGTVPPNVMILFDNSQSMNTALGGSTRIEVAGDAIKNLIGVLYPSDGAGGYTATVRLGLTVFDKTTDYNGGVIEEPISDTNKQALIDTVDATVTWRLANPVLYTRTPLSEAMVDIGRYFSGEHGFGTYPAVGNTSPMDFDCRESFAVVMTDGEPTADQNNHHGVAVAGTSAYSNFVDTIGNDDGDANECNADAPAICIDNPEGGRDDLQVYSDGGTDWFDDVTYYLANTDLVPDASVEEVQNIRTYTIGFTIDHPLLQEAATNGQGDFLTASDAAALATSLQEAFNSIFDEIQTSFTSSVVPGASLGLGNAFYNSYFRASNDAVWEGHLEALRISQTGVIQDSTLAVAVDASTGDLLDSRVPFWDAATPLKTNTNRTIYTTISGGQEDFDNVLVSSTLLDVDTPTYANFPNSAGSGVDTVSELVDAIIGYIHGKDGFDEDDDGIFNEMRATVLGDIFHSPLRAIAAPTRLNITEAGYLDFYNAYRGRDRVIYAGANAGLFHAFDAGEYQIGDDATTPELESRYYTPGSGAERFAYAPGLLLDRLQLVPQNSPRSEFFVDGPIAVADAWLSDGTGTDITKTQAEWATVLIAGFREGGPGYLALDISDPDAATVSDDHGPYPVMLWEFDDADLGQSWSEPIITKVKMRHPTVGTGDKCFPNDGDGDCREQWVAIFGGGYTAGGDPNRPASYIGASTDAGWSDESKAIYMVAIDDGSVIAKVEFDATDNPEMKYSIPSAPAVLDLDFDGFADVVYIGDVGGQVWKWDIHNVGEDTDADPLVDNWSSGIFFETPPVTLSDGTTKHYRSFFFPPEATFAQGELVLAFGSGERHNLGYIGDTDASVADENRFYLVQDPTPTGAGAFATTLTDTSLTDVTALDTDSNLSDGGYYFTVAKSEKFVTEVTIFAGFVIIGTYTPVPSADLCATSAGQSFIHVFNVASGRGYFEDASDPPSEDRRAYIGGGFPSSPTVVVADNPDDDKIIITTSEGPKVITVDAPPRTTLRGSMIYWKQEM
jgi:type IV pilus assembly protein PilY1